jgi:hypothetical protein
LELELEVEPKLKLEQPKFQLGLELDELYKSKL